MAKTKPSAATAVAALAADQDSLESRMAAYFAAQEEQLSKMTKKERIAYLAKIEKSKTEFQVLRNEVAGQIAKGKSQTPMQRKLEKIKKKAQNEAVRYKNGKKVFSQTLHKLYDQPAKNILKKTLSETKEDYIGCDLAHFAGDVLLSLHEVEVKLAWTTTSLPLWQRIRIPLRKNKLVRLAGQLNVPLYFYIFNADLTAYLKIDSTHVNFQNSVSNSNSSDFRFNQDEQFGWCDKADAELFVV